MNNLILYQEFLNEIGRTIALVYVFWFCIIFFHLVSIILLENFFLHFHLKIIFDMLEYFIIGWLFTNFSKEIAKLFSWSTRTSSDNSSSFSVYHRTFFIVLAFLFGHDNLLKPVESFFWIIRIDFLTLQWYHDIRFYYFFYFLSSKNIVLYLSGWNFNSVDQIFQFTHRLDAWIEDDGMC